MRTIKKKANDTFQKHFYHWVHKRFLINVFLPYMFEAFGVFTILEILGLSVERI